MKQHNPNVLRLVRFFMVNAIINGSTQGVTQGVLMCSLSLQVHANHFVLVDAKQQVLEQKNDIAKEKVA